MRTIWARRMALGAIVVCLSPASCKESKTNSTSPPTASVKAAAASASAKTKNKAKKKATGKDPKAKSIEQLPGVNETYYMAANAGLTGEIAKRVELADQNFKNMKEGDRALRVGAVLANLAVLSADPSIEVPPAVLGRAKDAIESLSPPDSVKQRVDRVMEEARKGTKGKKLRAKIDELIQASVADIENDPALKAKAELVRIGAYLHLASLVAEAIVATDKPDQKKLDVLTRGPEHETYRKWLDAMDEDTKKQALVVKASEALKKMAPLVAKEHPTADDAKAIAEATKSFS